MEETRILGGGGHERIVDFPNFGNGVFKFSFVRNPWDRFLSAWYTQEISVGNGKKEFTEFVIDQCSYGLTPWRNVHRIHFMPACYFILDEHDKIGVDTSETWDIVGKLYQRDIAVFGYESEFEVGQ
jgi:hypothetical protein